MKKPFIVGVSGLAKSGKNSFCNLVEEELFKTGVRAVQLSFAFQLRKDLDPLGYQHGFDVWTQGKEKEKIRPLLTWWGDFKRSRTKGRYFIDALDKQVKEFSSHSSVFLVSDLRFAQYAGYDEVNYCKDNGVVVHISKYTLPNPNDPTIKWFDTPPNKLEAENDPKIKYLADYVIEWESVEGDIEQLRSYAINFVDWLYRVNKFQESLGLSISDANA